MRKTEWILRNVTNEDESLLPAQCAALGSAYPPEPGTPAFYMCELARASVAKFAQLLAPAMAAERAGKDTVANWLIQDAYSKYKAYQKTVQAELEQARAALAAE